MSTHGKALSSGELSCEMHPLRPKPVVNSNDIQPRRFVVARHANRQRSNLLNKLSRIALLRGNKLCDSTEHALPPNFHHYTCALNWCLCKV